MKKAERIQETIRLAACEGTGETQNYPAEYRAFFTLFNRGDFYEAHDVLEHLWLRSQGAEYRFYKGLIQLAGAFVHMKKQRERPGHPKDGRRLAPAARLLRLALANWENLPESFQGLNLSEVRSFCQQTLNCLESGNFLQNPWHPEHPPALHVAPPIC